MLEGGREGLRTNRRRRRIRWGYTIVALLILGGVLYIPVSRVDAQGREDEEVYLDYGERETIHVSNQYYEIYVYRKGGQSLEGLELYVRVSRTETSDCDFDLLLYHSDNYLDWRDDIVDIEVPISNEWSSWSSITANRYDDHIRIWFKPETDVCSRGEFDIEIALGEIREEPPTEPPTELPTEPPPTEPPPNEPPPTKPPTTEAPTKAPPSFEVEFWADEYQLKSGQCTELHWEASGAEEVYWEGGSTYHYADVSNVCPVETTTYTLEVLGQDGKWHYPELTIEVERIECDPTGKLGVILIVTDSKQLAGSTGDTGAWDTVKPALQRYYESGVVNCEGWPIFMDMAELYPNGGYGSAEVKQAILSELNKWKVAFPLGQSPPLGALAIIGGPDVIPMPQVPDPTGSETWIYTDDYYANLDNDPILAADTVITRLPDGHNTGLMMNYINSLAAGMEPPEGGVILASLQTSAHRLNFLPNYATQGQLAFDDEALLNLDDILKEKAGSVTYLLSPIWSTWNKSLLAVDPNLIRADDLINIIDLPDADSKVSTQLNVKDVLFHYLGNFDNYSWTAKNVAANATTITAYDVGEAWAISPGAQIFALLPGSADLTHGYRDETNSIPLALLKQGVHHYIGSTGYLFFLTKNPHSYAGSPEPLVDIGITQYSGALTQYYYRHRSADPATSFWSAKLYYAQEHGLLTPWDYKTYHSFIYYGLPEKGRYLGSYQSVNLIPMPSPAYNPLPPLKDCPSGDTNDCDRDAIPDNLEHYLVETFKPYLIFDENENQLQKSNPFATYWQVSPATLDGLKGVYITLVMTYPEDWGIHDVDYNSFSNFATCNVGGILGGFFNNCVDDSGEWFKDPWGKLKSCGKGTLAAPLVDLGALLGELGDINPGSIFFGHAGDTEAIRLFVAGPGSGVVPEGAIIDQTSKWFLTHIDWKRHHEKFGSPKSIKELTSEGMALNATHPIVFVSEDKHAMYPSYDMCEAYTMDISEEAPEVPEYAGCIVKFEDCGGEAFYGVRADIQYIPYTPPEKNVGEVEQTARIVTGESVLNASHLIEDLSPEFPCENAWNTQEFCGGLRGYGCDPIFNSSGALDEPCAGGMGNMWTYPSLNLNP